MKLDINSHIIEKLRMMRKNNVLCDLEVYSSDGMKQRVHSCIWVAAFEDCRTIQSNKYNGCENKTSKIELSDINGDVLSTIVDFIYGEEIISIPVGLDGALKQLGFHGFRFYLDSGLCNYTCNQESSLSSAEQPTDQADKIPDLPALDPSEISQISSSTNEVKTEIIEENPSLSPDTKIHTIPVSVKLEPIDTLDPSSPDDENEELLNNIKIYSKQEDDNETVTVCVEYECPDKDEDVGVPSGEIQATFQPCSTPEDKTINTKDRHEKSESITQVSQDSAPSCLIQNPVHSSKSFAVSVANVSGSSHSSKKPLILPKFSNSQGDVVTVATFLSFAELQKKGKSWKVQESLVPIPISGNPTEAFNKLPIFPQNSQVKTVGEKRGRGRPKAYETEHVKAPKVKKTPAVQARSSGSSAIAKSKGKLNSVTTVTLASASANMNIKSSFAELAQKRNSLSGFTSTCASPVQHPALPLTYIANHNPVTSKPQALISTEQPKLAVPTSLPTSSVSVTITPQQQGFGTLHTMIPCVDFYDPIPVGCIGSVAPKINPSIFVQPSHTACKTLTNKSLVNQVSKQVVKGGAILSIPPNNSYITCNPFIPITPISSTVISKSQASVLKTMETTKSCKKQTRMGKSFSAPSLPQKMSSVDVESGAAKYREIKPKIKEPEIKAAGEDIVVTVEKPLRKPRKRTRSLQSSQTLLNEQIDKYISDKVKKTKKYITPSSLKIKMNPTHKSKFLKRKKALDMVAELYKKSGQGEFLDTVDKSVQSCGQENTPKQK